MIGLLDIEFNSGGPTGKEKNEFTLIELTIQIVDEKENYKVIDLYDEVVRPPKGRTILNDKIKELTTITQAEVDKGIDMGTVYSDLKKLYDKYNIELVYVWGNCDEDVMRWNFEKYGLGEITGLKRDEVCIPFTDLGSIIKEKYEGRHTISQLNMSVLCECKPIMQHRAYADVETMRNILINLADTEDADIRDRYRAYDVYADLREMYNKMKNVINLAREYDIEIDELVETAKAGTDFPLFDDAYNDTYNKRTFSWL